MLDTTPISAHRHAPGEGSLIQINPQKAAAYNRAMLHKRNDKRADGHLDVLGSIPA